MFARYAQPVVLAIESIEIEDMRNQHTMDFADCRGRHVLSGFEKVFDLAEQPGTSLRSTAYHYRISTGILQYLPGFFRRGDVAISDDGQIHAGFHCGNRVVFSLAGIRASAGTTMNGERLNAAC